MARARARIDLDALWEAYLATGSQRAAAARLGINDRTLNRRRKEDPDLDRVLSDARVEFLAIRRESKPHGSRAKYAAGCRCDECRAANTEAAAQARALRQGYRPMQIPHGIGGYRNYACRCPICRQAAAEDIAAYRARRRAA